MHELSFAQQIMENVLREAAAYPGARIVRVRLRADELLALEPASLRFALEALAVGTPMEGAEIDMRETGPEWRCTACGPLPAGAPPTDVCSQCGGPIEARGMELVIEEIELDDETDQG